MQEGERQLEPQTQKSDGPTSSAATRVPASTDSTTQATSRPSGLTVAVAKEALATLRDESSKVVDSVLTGFEDEGTLTSYEATLSSAIIPSNSTPATTIPSPPSPPEDIPNEMSCDSSPMIAANETKFRKFRDPHKDPLEVALQYKVMALSQVSSEDQTFTMTIMEDVAIWITRREFDEYIHCDDRTEYRPHHFVHTYVYNSCESEWQDPNRTVCGCAFHIRDVFDDQRCWAFRQRQGKITFNQPFELRNYPFDVQDLTCRFALYSYTNMQAAQQIRVMPMYGGATYSAKFVEPNDEYKVYREHRSFYESGGYINCTYKIGREWRYYLWRVVFVLSIVTLTGLASFLSFDGYLDQMSHLSTVMLTDVAYLYTIQEHMPRLRYFTLLDWCVFGNIMFVFCIFVQITILELWDVDVNNDTGTSGYSLRDKFLIGNVCGYFGCCLVYAVICNRAKQSERKKLGEPYSEEKMLEQQHNPFPINLSFHKPGTTMNCLLLKPRKQVVDMKRHSIPS